MGNATSLPTGPTCKACLAPCFHPAEAETPQPLPSAEGGGGGALALTALVASPSPDIFRQEAVVRPEGC